MAIEDGEIASGSDSAREVGEKRRHKSKKVRVLAEFPRALPFGTRVVVGSWASKIPPRREQRPAGGNLATPWVTLAVRGAFG